MLEDSGHLPGCGRDSGDCHDRLAINFQNLVRAIVDHRVTGSRSSIARDEHAISELERENRGRFRRLKVFWQLSWPGLAGGREQTVTPQQRRKIFQTARS